MRPLLLIIIAACSTPQSTCAQELADTTFTWRGYASASVCRVRIFRSASGVARPMTVVLDEIAENPGRTTLDDAPHLVELIARAFELDPESAFWIFRWGAFSFLDAAPSRKEVYFRATFRRSDSGSLGTPFWRLVNRATVVDYTDRAFR